MIGLYTIPPDSENEPGYQRFSVDTQKMSRASVVSTEEHISKVNVYSI